MEIAQDRRLKIWSPLLVLSMLFVFYAFFVGIPTSYFYIDAGWAAELSSRNLKGQILYRDLVSLHGKTPVKRFAVPALIVFSVSESPCHRVLASLVACQLKKFLPHLRNLSFGLF